MSFFLMLLDPGPLVMWRVFKVVAPCLWKLIRIWNIESRDFSTEEYEEMFRQHYPLEYAQATALWYGTANASHAAPKHTPEAK